MTKHETELIGWKKLSNGQVSMCVRCCGDPETDSWASPLDVNNPASVDATETALRERVAREHENMAQALAKLQSRVGTKQTHQIGE